MAARRYPPLAERFWSRVSTSPGCWLWTGSTRAGGYGQISNGGRPLVAHRVSWLLAFGPIPEGQQVLHRCDVKLCVRPSHLFLGTQRDNMDDMAAKGRRATGKRQDCSGAVRGDGWASSHEGRMARGERVHGARLTAADVREVRRLSAEGWVLRELSEKFGVRMSTLSLVIRRETWKHIE